MPLPLPQAPSTLALAWKWPGHSVGGFQFPELPVCWEGTGGQWGRRSHRRWAGVCDVGGLPRGSQACSGVADALVRAARILRGCPGLGPPPAAGCLSCVLREPCSLWGSSIPGVGLSLGAAQDPGATGQGTQWLCRALAMSIPSLFPPQKGKALLQKGCPSQFAQVGQEAALCLLRLACAPLFLGPHPVRLGRQGGLLTQAKSACLCFLERPVCQADPAPRLRKVPVLASACCRCPLLPAWAPSDPGSRSQQVCVGGLSPQQEACLGRVEGTSAGDRQGLFRDRLPRARRVLGSGHHGRKHVGDCPRLGR